MLNLLVEAPAEVQGTGDLRQRGEADLGQFVVAGDLETTVDLLELGHADVASILVADEGQVAGLCEVRSAEGLEAISPEAELTGKIGQRRHLNTADIAEGHVRAGNQVGKLNLQGVQVARKVDQVSGLGQAIKVDVLQVAVLGDVKAVDLVQGDAVQVGQAGVGDLEVVRLADLLAEIQSLQAGHDGPLDGANAGERAHAKSGEGFEGIQLELVANGLKVRGRQLGQRRRVLRDQAARDLLDTIQLDAVADLALDLDIAIQLLAAAVAIGIALARDLDGVSATAIYHQSVSHSQRLGRGKQHGRIRLNTHQNRRRQRWQQPTRAEGT